MLLKSDNIWCGQQGGHWGLQGAISCADARPPVAASTGPLTLAGIPSIRSFVAKSTNSRNYRLQWPPWVRMGFKKVNLAPISFGGTKPNGKRLTERGSTLPPPLADTKSFWSEEGLLRKAPCMSKLLFKNYLITFTFIRFQRTTLSIRYKENLTVFAQMPLNQG